MRLLAISDLHFSHPINRKALLDIPDHGDDWLIVAGDVAERLEDQEFALSELAKRFAQLVWVPGNHDLWALSRNGEKVVRGDARYRALVEIARSHGAVTPEDHFPDWPEPDPRDGTRRVVAPLFLLYDYSFRPYNVPRNDVRRWAREKNSGCADEFWLHPEPHQSREEWCVERCREAEMRLMGIPENKRAIIVNHWPMRQDLIRIPRAPRFTPWCGTVLTRNWHVRFRAEVVVTGHLHTRRTDWIDGSRFEEVSLGYPGQWRQEFGIAHYFREIIGTAGRAGVAL